MKHLRRISVVIAVVLVLPVLVAAVLLSSSIFAPARTAFVERTLTRTLNYPVIIKGSVALSFLPEMAIVATGIRLPASNDANADLAYMEEARLAIAPLDRVRGGIAIPAMAARGLSVRLERRADGTTTWTQAEQTVAEQTQTEQAPAAGRFDPVEFLGQRRVNFSDITIHRLDETTGFEFDFALDNFDITRDTGENIVELTSHGSVNNEPFFLGGFLPSNGPFAAHGRLGSLDFSLTGDEAPEQSLSNYEARLVIETPDLQNLVETLKLEGDVAGNGRLAARLIKAGGRYRFEDLDLSVKLDRGPIATLTGRIGRPATDLDLDLQFALDVPPKENAVEKALFLKDIRLKKLSGEITGSNGAYELADILIDTNAFDEELGKIGPFQVGRLSRTPEGELQLLDVTLALGPPGEPYLVAEGEVENLLTFKDYSVSGNLDLAATQVMRTLKPEMAEKFGRVSGSLDLKGIEGKAVLSDLQLATEGSDLWSLSLDASVLDVAQFEDARIALKLATPDSATFFDALQLEVVDTGAFGLDLSLEKSNELVALKSDIGVADSDISTELNLRLSGGKPQLRGTVRSGNISLSDVRNAVVATSELARAKDVYVELRRKDRAEARSGDEEFQPLVLQGDGSPATASEAPSTPSPPSPDTDSTTQDDDLSEFQPLVLADPVETGDEDMTDYQPLVLPDQNSDFSLQDLRDLEKTARLLDAEIGIDVARITGQQGISSLKSRIEMKEGLLRFGPVDLHYGGGKVNVRGQIDMLSAPEMLAVSGRAGGWDIGGILEEFGVDIPARGALAGSFNISGPYRSLSGFMHSMRGSATVEMRNGRIGTTLVNLAGLGVLPWLFSRERTQGYLDLVCFKAPVRFDGGRISASDVVLETRQVQVVGAGTVDLRKNTVDFRADPRPIGRPLARSAWPFAITGSLSAPTVKVATRKIRRTQVPVVMTEKRVPCRPDAKQLVPESSRSGHPGPR